MRENPSGNVGNDNRPVPPAGGLFSDMVMGLRLYSRLPTGARVHEAPDLSRIAMALPFAGLAIGAGPALVLLFGVVAGLPPLFAALLALAAAALVTGAMSEDALGDAADGLFGGTTPERRLEIMRDSRQGSFGVLAIVLATGLKAAALGEMAATTPLGAALCWLAAGLVARSASLVLPLALPQARAEGAGASAGAPSRNAFAVGLVFAFVLTVILAGPFVGIAGIAAGTGVGALVVLFWTRTCLRRVGGCTGDLIGAAQALVEIGLLGAFMWFVA